MNALGNGMNDCISTLLELLNSPRPFQRQSFWATNFLVDHG